MKKCVVVALCLVLHSLCAFAGGELKIGDTFTDRMLQPPAEQHLSEYLGRGADSGDFAVRDIRGELVLVEFFSMYCPHCQHEAPLLNSVYELIRENKLDTKIKMIGIGIGNSAYEVGIFQKKFQIPFPLFADEDFIWHKDVGQVGTPYFVLVRNEAGRSTVVLTHLGRIDNASRFFRRIKKHL